MKAALLVESLTGNTWQAAEMIADKLQQEKWTITGLSRVRTPNLASVEQADVVLVGTWTHGLFVVGQAPFALGNIANLPTMRGKKAACFLTFALNAGTSIDKLSTAVGQTGAEVVGGLEIKRNYLAAAHRPLRRTPPRRRRERLTHPTRGQALRSARTLPLRWSGTGA